ncbi:hypothetical protein [Streptomyces sp. t39]|uniref:hypothetical protein n=1 Tax=Streptomyces sp. t39 TaxID=1828156 RepID=UPI0011CE64BA|nr:hypothetical protein [Streptomyces sp. t39]TXS34973.1 hypothetical protein EAO77_38125 [Streptomyces sp. t39]
MGSSRPVVFRAALTTLAAALAGTLLVPPAATAAPGRDEPRPHPVREGGRKRGERGTEHDGSG